MKYRLHEGPPLTRACVCRPFLKRFHEAFPLDHPTARRCMCLERQAIVQATPCVDNHHQPPAEYVDIHLLDASLPEAGQYFGPYLAVIVAVGLHDSGIILHIDRQHIPAHWFSTPPSRGYACPVTNDASSEHRYNAR